MDEPEETRSKNKIYESAAFLYHLLNVGQQNVARTPLIFKTGILFLHAAFILYITGFVTPYWVVGEKHRHRHDARGDVPMDTWNSSLQGQPNSTHYGVWEECVEVGEGARSVCTIFTEDVDSVILMFGCVGGFILLGLCCWSCLSCVRKPKEGRYYFIVISAIFGGVFGLVSVLMFLVVEGVRNYSWAFALFLGGCMLELSASVVFLWGIRLASARGFFPQLVEGTADPPNTPSLPSIIVTGPTPTRHNQRRAVHVIHRSPGSQRGSRKEGDHVDFITLDMVAPVPGQAQEMKKKKKRGKKKRKGKGKKEGSSASTEATSPVQSLAQQVAEHHRSYANLFSSPPSPPPLGLPADTGPHVSSADPGQLFPTDTAHTVPQTPRDTSAVNVNHDQRPASVYIDLTGSSHATPSRHGRGRDPARCQRDSGRFKTPQRPDFRWARAKDAGRPAEGGPIRLLADVHQPDDLNDQVPTFPSRAGDPAPEPAAPHASPPQPARGEALQTLPTVPWHQPSPLRPTLKDCTPRGDPRPEAEPRPPCPESDCMKGPGRASPRVSGGGSGRRGDQDAAQYVRYSPDTYYQSRASVYSAS